MSAGATDSVPPVCASDLKGSRWSQATGDTYHALSHQLRRLAGLAASESKANEASALSLLADLCGMGLDTDTGKGPFQPLLRMQGRRSLLPEDLSINEVDAAVALLTETQLQ